MPSPTCRARSLPLLLLAFVLLSGGCGRGSQSIQASGTIEMDEIDVASLVGGRLVRLLVNEGDTVSAGQTLAVLDRGEVTAELQSRVDEAERAAALWRDQLAGPRGQELRAARAEVAAAAAQRRLAETEGKRAEALVRDQLASQAMLDRALAELQTARAREHAAAERLRLLEAGFRRGQVEAAREAAEAAKAQTSAARSRARELVLVAPISGVVLLKNAEPGEVLGPSVPALTLGNPDSLWMRVYVPAPELARIALGTRAEVEVQGFGRRRFSGRVVEIATRAEFTPRAALTEEERANLVFAVKVALAPSGGALKAGLPANARFYPESVPARAPASRRNERRG